MKAFLPLLLLIIFSSCKETNERKDSVNEADAELVELMDLMTGSFNSQKQSEADSSYFNISLHMYPIWKDRGNYLYVEQAMNSTQDKPYRQRIYEIKRLDETTFSSTIYTLEADSLWIGKWRNPGNFDSLSASDLKERKGCDVYLKRIGKKHFKGATRPYNCLSTLRGASYATSEVEITADKIISWDRGFDPEGNHMWGALMGGYIFDRISFDGM